MKRAKARKTRKGPARESKVRLIRCRVSPLPGADSTTERVAYRRAVRNILPRHGTARWLLEDIVVTFDQIGYVRFPREPFAMMVAHEVVGETDVGWVRIDSNTVTFTDPD